MKRIAGITYEAVMLILILISLAGIWLSNAPFFNVIHTVIWVIFLTDVIIRFIYAARRFRKWAYIKSHPFEIISVIPLEDFFLLARFARFLRFFRYKNILKRYIGRINRILTTIPFGAVTIGLFGLIAWYLIALVTVHGLSTADAIRFIIHHLTGWTEPIHRLPAFAVVLKIIGVIYTGLLLNQLFTVVQNEYDDYKSRKASNQTHA